MHILKTSWVICLPPKGCGWYWKKRVIRDHWWSRDRIQYRGAFWEDNIHDNTRICNRWVNQEDSSAYYCEQWLAEVSLSEAQRLSRKHYLSRGY